MPERKGPWSEESFLKKASKKAAGIMAGIGLMAGAERAVSKSDETHHTPVVAKEEVRKPEIQQTFENEVTEVKQEIPVPETKTSIPMFSTGDSEDEEMIGFDDELMPPSEEEWAEYERQHAARKERSKDVWAFLDRAFDGWEFLEDDERGDYNQQFKKIKVKPVGKGLPFEITLNDDGTYTVHGQKGLMYGLEADLQLDSLEDLRRIVEIKTSSEYNEMMKKAKDGMIYREDAAKFLTEKGLIPDYSSEDMKRKMAGESLEGDKRYPLDEEGREIVKDDPYEGKWVRDKEGNLINVRPMDVETEE